MCKLHVACEVRVEYIVVWWYEMVSFLHYLVLLFYYGFNVPEISRCSRLSVLRFDEQFSVDNKYINESIFFGRSLARDTTLEVICRRRDLLSLLWSMKNFLTFSCASVQISNDNDNDDDDDGNIHYPWLFRRRVDEEEMLSGVSSAVRRRVLVCVYVVILFYIDSMDSCYETKSHWLVLPLGMHPSGYHASAVSIRA